MVKRSKRDLRRIAQGDLAYMQSSNFLSSLRSSPSCVIKHYFDNVCPPYWIQDDSVFAKKDFNHGEVITTHKTFECINKYATYYHLHFMQPCVPRRKPNCVEILCSNLNEEGNIETVVTGSDTLYVACRDIRYGERLCLTSKETFNIQDEDPATFPTEFAFDSDVSRNGIVFNLLDTERLNLFTQRGNNSSLDFFKYMLCLPASMSLSYTNREACDTLGDGYCSLAVLSKLVNPSLSVEKLNNAAKRSMINLIKSIPASNLHKRKIDELDSQSTPLNTHLAKMCDNLEGKTVKKMMLEEYLYEDTFLAIAKQIRPCLQFVLLIEKFGSKQHATSAFYVANGELYPIESHVSLGYLLNALYRNIPMVVLARGHYFLKKSINERNILKAYSDLINSVSARYSCFLDLEPLKQLTVPEVLELFENTLIEKSSYPGYEGLHPERNCLFKNENII